ncbi:MAG: glycoside hydrolase family 15 protein [Gammaproteobacteria bacterium]
MHDLNLGVIGNGTFSALIDRQGRIVWCCMPRFDGEPVFLDLLGDSARPVTERQGLFEIEVIGLAHCQQDYLENTAVLVTRLEDSTGSVVEITDFAPRFRRFDRQFRPMTLVRRLRAGRGTPRLRIRLRPVFDYGATPPVITHGSNHIRYVGPRFTLRLTTSAPVTYILQETSFYLEEPLAFFLGPDESLSGSVVELTHDFLERTIRYWREWVRHLAVPLEWQRAVIRAAIALKLCVFEETGAVIAAMTTSIPEAPNSGRNWDYRFCWLRDAFFVVRALNRLGAVDIMENYLRYLRNLVAEAEDGHLQPVYGIGLEKKLIEREITSLPGYRGMGPVRVGNQAYEHLQYDVYGDVILASTQAFFDERLLRTLGKADFAELEVIGERAFKLHDQPDAGMWELRTKEKIHTSSSLMCWAACDRLAKIAVHLGLAPRAQLWRERASLIHGAITERAWNSDLNAFADSLGGASLDASLLLMAEVGFLEPRDPRFVATVTALETALRRGKNMFRYVTADDFGLPKMAFNICTFWYIEALAVMGREAEAREIFEHMLASCNHVGLLSEDLDPDSHELWGNYPQTYSLVGIINAARRLTRRWEDVL